MSKEIEFFFDFGSPYSRLSMVKLPAIARAAGATIIYRPIGVLRLMELSGNQPTTLQSRSKFRYAMKDLARWSELYGVGHIRNAHLKTMPLEPLLRGALVAIQRGEAETYVSTVFEAIYNDGLDMGDPQIFAETLSKAGMDGAAILKERDDPVLVEALEKGTADAAERGLFGVPAVLFGEDLYFGNDRLDFLERALAK